MSVNRPNWRRQFGDGRGAGANWREAKAEDAEREVPYQRWDRREDGKFHRPGRGGARFLPSGRGRRGNHLEAIQQVTDYERIPHQSRSISYEQLMELSEKPPAEILLTIQTDTGFQTLVNDSIRMEEKVFVLVFRTVSKACRSVHCRKNLAAFLGQFLSSRLVSEQLPAYVTQVHHLQNFGPFLSTTLEYLMVFFKSSLDLLPTRASDKLETCILRCQTTVQAAVDAGHVPNEETGKLIVDLENLRDRIVEEYQRSEHRAKGRMTDENANRIHNPPDDFRKMSVVPTIEELHGLRDVYLRPNVINGRYPDGENYLDTQFRLLREDFISTLRDGIVEYRAQMQSLQTTQEEAARQLRISTCDLHLYYNVRLLGMSSTYKGVVYILQLDLTHLRNVRWEDSKRLITGSLLCLSSDNFDTIALATVVQRKPEELKKGRVGVSFIEGHRLNTGRNARDFRFLIAESTAYFEAYRPVLKTLQELDGTKLPLGRYIIEVNTDISPPKYLRGYPKYYEMGSLLPEKEYYEYVEFSVLDDDAWPNEREFELDKAQYRALKSALTRELAIIQGPPGTGKTYIGLKIVQALLANRCVWMPERPNPILVVCFTNHALDQFLEGILHTTENVVRVGGRSKSELLKTCNLQSVKDDHTSNMTVPSHIYKRSKKIRWELKEMGKMFAKQIVEKYRARGRMNREVLCHQELGKFMMLAHYNAFDDIAKRMKTKSAIMFWLSQGTFDVDMQPNLQDDAAEVREQRAENPVGVEMDNQDMDEDRALETIDIVHIDDKDFDDVRWPVTGDEWQVQGGWKRVNKAIQRELMRTDAMHEAEARAVRDIWSLEGRQRWRLYRYWVQRLVDDMEETLHWIEWLCENLAQQLNEVELEEDIEILRKAHVVGMTTTGAAKCQVVLREIRPQIVIVEEAAEVLEAHILTSLTEGCEHLILIGDHQQLRPNSSVFELTKHYNLNISLFERLLKNRMPFERLATQHRMRPSIAQLLVPNIYDNLENHPSVKDYGHIPGIEKDVFFLAHQSKEQHTRDTTSKENSFEAEFIVGLCRHLLLQGINPEKITILSTYVGQMYIIKKLMKDHFFTGVRVTVVDNYQGEENDVILLSLVRSNDEGKVGFLSVANRICVALSRARMGLYCIGNFDFLAENADVWRPIISTLKTNAMIGTKMRLICQNHPKIATEVSCGKDFESVPEGGCQNRCEYRFSCGHQCPRFCHVIDSSLEECKCKMECDKTLSCGHPCKNLCGRTCDCGMTVSVKSVCGHIVQVKCADSRKEKMVLKMCTAPCGELLSCKHSCVGTCANCYQGRFHTACKRKCDRTLVCGHKCRLACAFPCLPCKEKCQNRCLHSSCQRECGIPCSPCKEPCPWQCVHRKCSKRCGDMCDRPPCNEPCPEILECGHPCIGLCGDTCPKKCGICDADDVHEIFFGGEDEDDARFVLLEDCNHIILASAMDELMTKEQGGSITKLRECPKCKTVIRKNLRYGNMIKESLQDIVNVKLRIIDDLKSKESYIGKVILQAFELETNFHELETNFPEACLKLCECIARRCSPEENLTRKYIPEAKYFKWEYIPEAEYFTKRYIPEEEYFTLQNVATFLERMLWLRMKTCNLYRSGRHAIEIMLQQLEVWICDVIPASVHSIRCGSEQQIAQLGRELQRAICLYNLLNLVSCGEDFKRLDERAMHKLDEALKLVYSLHAFDQAMEDAISVALKEMQAIESHLKFSEEGRVQIVKALGMGTGQWFKCPRGHVYVITEYGGIMLEGVCDVCNPNIGWSSSILTAIVAQNRGLRSFVRVFPNYPDVPERSQLLLLLRAQLAWLKLEYMMEDLCFGEASQNKRSCIEFL